MAERPGVLGLRVLFEGPNPSVDIVAVHGLGSTPDWAWIWSDDDKEVHVNWLAEKDMLPAKLHNSRIMTFNYESKWLLEAPKQRRSLCAIQLLTALDNKRKEEGNQKQNTKYRPIIFIGHSFGGVVIEESLVSANSDGGDFQFIALSTVGIIFLGTPHRGSHSAKWGDIAATSAKALGFRSEDSILKDLREGSETLRDLLYHFTLWANRISLKIVCFFEQHETDYGKRYHVKLKPLKQLVVDEASACIDGYRKIPLPTDHFKINKYSGPDDPSYLGVYPIIVDMAHHASQVIQGRLNPQTIVQDNSRIPEENLDCLRCLFSSNPGNDPQSDLAAIQSAKGDRVPGTCEWILAQDRYTSWLVEDSPQLLWLSGGPGIGKTTMSSFLVQELTNLTERSLGLTLAYYFCDDKNEGRRTATAILRGLLLQILRQQPKLFKHIQPDFEISRDSLFKDFHALWKVFVAIIKDPEVGMIYCIIDALDECAEGSRHTFLTNFKKIFCPPQQSGKIFVKFIVTSRPNSDIVESLSEVSPKIRNLQIDSGKINADLSKFISVKVDELSTQKGYPTHLKQTIQYALTKKAGGTFLYVSLVLDDLKRTKISSQVKRKLEVLPPDLNEVYSRILSQIDADCVEIAKFVLSWVVVARKPLKMDELAMARALGPEEWEGNTIPPQHLLDELKDGYKCCEPLIYVDTENETINLVHQSAKDYLLGTYLQAHTSLSQYRVVTDTTNLLIFQTCWRYLSLEEFKRGTKIIGLGPNNRVYEIFCSELFLRSHCFLRYAGQEWLEHALAAEPAFAAHHILFKSDNLKKLPTLRDFWLIRAAADGQEVVVRQLLENGAEKDSRDSLGRTPLYWAAALGHEVVVELLLAKEGIDMNSKDNFRWTPLAAAIRSGHEVVVKLLLAKDSVETNPKDGKKKTPLSLAAKSGHEAIVKMLLASGKVNTDSKDDMRRTPLSWAAGSGHAAIVKMLLESGKADADVKDRWGETPLSLAAENGNEAIVKMLLASGKVNVDSRNNMGWSPLSWAVENGNEAVVKMLLASDKVDADSKEYGGRTPLSSAAENGHEAIVKMLLASGKVDADSKDSMGWTPLSEAAKNGHEAVAKMLLESGKVDVDSKDNMGQTPLKLAVRYGHDAVAKLLREVAHQ